MRTYATIFCLLLTAGPACPVEPTLARLSFSVRQGRFDDFKTVYRDSVRTVLEKHDLVESSRLVRTAVPGVFSRLFVFESKAEALQKMSKVSEDPDFVSLLARLGERFGGKNGIETRFTLYETPVGDINSYSVSPDDSVLAGSGTGLWYTYGVAEGMGTGAVTSIVADDTGNMWFGIFGGGASRFDGTTWKTFTSIDGLVHDSVRQICLDRHGHLWFGTEKGVSRYDGQEFRTVLGSEVDVRHLLVDQDGDVCLQH